MAGLEASLSHMIAKHAQRQALVSARVEGAKKEALSAVADLSGQLVNSVNGGVQQSFINEKQIEIEARSFTGTVQRFGKQTTQWLSVFHAFDSALKEIGDFENWIKVMDYDCECIENALRYISSNGS